MAILFIHRFISCFQPDKCRQEKGRMHRLPLKGYMSVKPTTEDNIMAALVAEGPLAVAVNAVVPTFLDYKEGKDTVIHSIISCRGSVT